MTAAGVTTGEEKAGAGPPPCTTGESTEEDPRASFRGEHVGVLAGVEDPAVGDEDGVTTGEEKAGAGPPPCATGETTEEDPRASSRGEPEDELAGVEEGSVRARVFTLPLAALHTEERGGGVTPDSCDPTSSDETSLADTAASTAVAN